MPIATSTLPERASMPRLTHDNVRAYLETRVGGPVTILGLALLGDTESADLKGYGYGTPVKVEFVHAGRKQAAVIETVRPGGFGHEHMADRAQSLLWSHAASNSLPLHVRSLDVGGFRDSGALVSLGDVEEFFVLNEFAEGDGYYRDLERLRDGGELRTLDIERADALCDYLVRIHRVPGPDPSLYVRRTRELLGHNECIMGILDSYPPIEGVTARLLEDIEHACVRWRWRLKPRTDRLRQIHGDFHPWNILFNDATGFVVMDRSRGEWGDPADDVACLTLNYVFFSLQRDGRLGGGFAALFDRFWDRYIEGSGDREIGDVVAPYLAFRALVMACPVWYPHLASRVRSALLTLVGAVLDRTTFDPSKVNEYCGVG